MNEPKSKILVPKRAKRERGGRRNHSLYDAVAGRVTNGGARPALSLLETNPANFWRREKQHSLRPDEALFRSGSAPERYAEDDWYEQDRLILPEQALPDSDLLKAIHAYSADFYQQEFPESCGLSQGSLDETALLALGYLIEEAATQMLGKTGDMALVEGKLMEDGTIGVGNINGYTYRDLPSIKSTHTVHKLPERRKKLGFMRFTHPKS